MARLKLIDRRSYWGPQPVDPSASKTAEVFPTEADALATDSRSLLPTVVVLGQDQDLESLFPPEESDSMFEAQPAPVTGNASVPAPFSRRTRRRRHSRLVQMAWIAGIVVVGLGVSSAVLI